MILLVGSIVVALLIGGLIGYIIGSHSAKAISQSIEGVKDKVEQVHTKAESIKDDLIAIEGIANTIKEATPDAVKEEASKVGDDITNFVQNEVKELDALTDSKEATVAEDSSTDAVASETPVSTDEVKTETAVAGDGTVAKTGIVAG